jgi:hypothetical protein
MSSLPSEHGGSGLLSRLPGPLRPRTSEDPGTGQMRLIETTLLVIVGLVLLIATVNDLSRQASANHRLQADLTTWRAYTGHDYPNIESDQELFGATSQKEVVCGNTTPGAPKSRTQICLAVWGPVVDGKRTVHGGWYLPANAEDERSLRYGCFGEEEVQELCAR